MPDESLWNRAGIAEFWRRWEGQVVDGLIPLRQYLGGSADRAVFLTEYYPAGSRRAVVKLVLASGRNGAMMLERWRAAEAVSHPHLVCLFGCGSGRLNEVEFVYVVMEHAEEDLAGVLQARSLTVAETHEMLRPTLDALVYLHSRGFVHSHLSPANVLAVDDQLRLSSDSLCRWEEDCTSLRSRDQWDAPETATGALSPAADIWSLGAVLSAALTRGQERSARLPEPFQEIARHCLQTTPDDRWTASEILGYLEAPVPATARSGTRPRSLMWMAISLAAVLASAAAVAWLRSGDHHTVAPIAASAVRPSPVQPNLVHPEPPKRVRSSTAPSHQVLPDIPRKARETIHGTVRINVRVDVDEAGNVMSASVEPPEASHYLANLTLDAARRWHFSPGGRQAWLLRFQLLETGSRVVPERLR